MFPKSFKKLIDHFAALPSVGPRMAERLVLHLFRQEQEKLADFSQSLAELKKNIRYCRKCFNISENDLCAICQNPKRQPKTICVVEEPLDIVALEKTGQYSGLYHVLGGTIDMEQNKLKITELEKRLKNEKIEELILAVNPTTEGDATALYLTRTFKPLGIKITRLARGLATGGDIEHADEITLGSAIINRN